MPKDYILVDEPLPLPTINDLIREQEEADAGLH